MSGDYDQTDQFSHGCFLWHCSKGQHLPWARISGVYPVPMAVGTKPETHTVIQTRLIDNGAGCLCPFSYWC